MTVQELITELQKYKPNFKVRVTDDNWDGREKDIESTELEENYGEGNYVVLVIT